MTKPVFLIGVSTGSFDLEIRTLSKETIGCVASVAYMA